jgi:predicted nucleotidyltransferase
VSSLDRHTIFLTLGGSRAHGTAREDSDVDVRGVCVAPLPVRLSLFSRFEQREGPPDSDLSGALREHLELERLPRTECVVYDVAKFVTLCAGANPNALEILFADERDWIVATPAFRRLHDARHEFLTKHVKETFLGYALGQLKKLEAHRSQLGDAPSARPTRRNPTRAALERAHGYDTKHAMHVIRLMRMGIEALERGELLVRRPDAAELAAIRDGAWSFDELMTAAAALKTEMERVAAGTALRDDVDRERVNQLAFELMTAG